MDYTEFINRLGEIEKVIAETKQAAPADGEMIRGDVERLFNLVSSLEADTQYMQVGEIPSAVGYVRVLPNARSRYRGQTLEIIEIVERVMHGKKTGHLDYHCKLPGFDHAKGWFSNKEVEVVSDQDKPGDVK